ncbi:hypothetical protein LLG95_14825 [bacterium]|nr:hypothetical protein [bacterium]
MEFKFIPLDQARRADWDRFVAGNPHAWVGHDLAHIDFEASLGHESASHLVLDTRGQVIGVVPLFLVEYGVARVFRFRAMVTGTSLRGGPLPAADMPPKTRRDFWRAFAEWAQSECARRGIDEIRVNLPHFIGQTHALDFYEVNPLRELGFKDVPNLTMLLDLQATDDLVANFEGRCRNSYKKALSAGAEWEAIGDRATWLSLEDLNKQTFADEQAEAYSRHTMEVIWDRFAARGLVKISALKHEGRYISACVRAGTNFSEYIWMIFNERPRRLQGSTNLLIGKDLEDMRSRGVRWCELGSLDFDDPRQHNIANFKRSFGGKVYRTLGCKLCLSPLKLASAQWLQAAAGKLKRARNDESN